MRPGATDYITKPFNPEELREILERVAGERRSARAASTPPANGERDALGRQPGDAPRSTS